MEPKFFFELLQRQGAEFFAGVPDSLLKDFCAYVADNVPQENHIISANEGAAIGLGVGYHLATQKIPLIYMQNSGLGNAINPLLSIADPDVYAVPLLIVIGWRGEPGVADEPQHRKQGRVMLAMLDSMEIPYEVITDDSQVAQQAVKLAFDTMKKTSAPFALVVRKGSFHDYTPKERKSSGFPLTREDAIKLIIDSIGSDPAVVSTTGMTSRELFECREALGQGHEKDFLTVGGMGHTSQIALGLALQKRDRQVFCLDGDGSVIMHMGSLAINAMCGANNFTHIVLNNGVHDSVGGQPTVGFDIDFCKIAKAVGYKTVLKAASREEILNHLGSLNESPKPAFLEIRVSQGARADLGRPTTTPQQNKKALMHFVSRPE